MDVPASVADLTPAFLAAALETASPIARGAAFSIEPVGVGYGFTSDSFRCSWADGASRRSVVVKLWDARGAGGRREPAVLGHFARRFGIRVAERLFAGVDDESGRAVLILEDLGTLTQGDALRTLGAADGRSLAGVLAALHATWWDHPELAALEWLPRIDALDRGPAWFRTRHRSFLERFSARLDAREHAALERAQTLARRADGWFAGSPQTLLHGDVHLDNVVFDGSDPILVDWARAARGPAEVDLAELLFGIVEPDDRAAVRAEYERGLRRRGVTIDTVDSERRLAAGAVRHFLRGTLGVATWQPRTDRQEGLIAVGIERARAALAWLQATHPELFGP